MGRSRSDELRRRWKAAQREQGTSEEKRADWMQAKSDNEQVHIHFNCTCRSCGQEFMICGLPCFVICPNCHLVLILQFGQT